MRREPPPSSGGGRDTDASGSGSPGAAQMAEELIELLMHRMAGSEACDLSDAALEHGSPTDLLEVSVVGSADAEADLREFLRQPWRCRCLGAAAAAPAQTPPRQGHV